MPRSAKSSGETKGRDAATAFVHAFDRMHDRVMMPSPRAALPLHISPPEGKSLVWMGTHGPCVMSEFARGLRMPLSTATHLVDRMVDKKLLVRRRSDRDRRIVEIELSGMGQRMYKRFHEQRLNGGKELLAQLDAGEQAALLRLMEKTIAPMER